MSGTFRATGTVDPAPIPDRHPAIAPIPRDRLDTLAARDERAATALLWHGCDQSRAEPKIEIGWISGRQQWAIDVLLAARLSITSYGALCTRGAVGPLRPYIPSPPFA